MVSVRPGSAVSQMPEEMFYVQLRFAGVAEWVTVAAAETRRAAAAYGGAAVANARDERGELASQVRVISASGLVRERGVGAEVDAVASLAAWSDTHGLR